MVKKSLSEFGSASMPLRCSALQTFIGCPWRVVSLMLELYSDDAGEPAQTGSATHAAIAAWHQNGRDVQKAKRTMLERVKEFPDAKLTEAGFMFDEYVRDPRNLNAEIVLCEEKVSFTIQAHESDPTGEPILITGTVDQVRRENGTLFVWDAKTSRRDPRIVLRESMFQLAGYTIGAMMALDEPVEPGGVMMIRGYMSKDRAKWAEKSPDGIFMKTAWTSADLEMIMRDVQITVANVRAGCVVALPNEHNCKWCSWKTEDKCLPAKQLTLKDNGHG